MNYYHNLITDKSWSTLKLLQKEFDFILIGGWAVFLYTRALKSKDIDIVLEYGELEKIKEKFDVSKNERLNKYEARLGETEIDIYVPFFSNPGLPAEDLKKFRISLEGFSVVKKEILAILKQKALKERADSVKGRKDLMDLISIFSLADFDWSFYNKTCSDYDLVRDKSFVRRTIGKTVDLEEIGLNAHKMAAVKKKIIAGMSLKCLKPSANLS